MKLVRESINFERGQEPKKSMDIGLHAKYNFWDLFVRCYELANISENFTYVSDIIADNKKNPYFVIESVFYYTDENNNKIPEQFVITFFYNEESKDLLCFNAITKDEIYFHTEKKFVEITTCFDEDAAKEMFESINFERGQEPKKSMDIGIQHSNPFQKEYSAWNVKEYMKEHRLSPTSILGKGLKKAAEMLKVSEEKILAAPDSNMEMSSSKIIKKEILNPNAKPGTDPITINLMENNYIYILNERYNQVLMILGTKY
ncbi:MAG: hypothetical protein PHF86_00740 [Candidatus Nanoarchaeia archaeon]|nr:hypothetical protein [Candidatus Nanoarchaeia archaeon]